MSICGFDYRLKMARNKDLSSETHQSILVLRNEGYSMRNLPFPAIVIYNINNVHTVFLINLMLFYVLSKTRTFQSDPKLLNGSVYTVNASWYETTVCAAHGWDTHTYFLIKARTHASANIHTYNILSGLESVRGYALSPPVFVITERERASRRLLPWLWERTTQLHQLAQGY